MLTRVIVATYVWLLEIALWLSLAVAAVVGYRITVPVMNAAGAVVAPEFAWNLLGALVLAAVTFLALAVVVGPVLILIDVRQAVRRIEASVDRREDSGRSLSSERKEPSI